MTNSWSDVKRTDILNAIKKYDSENISAYSRNTFLKFNGKLYPAKHIRGLAYEIAFGIPISKSKYSGGKETVQFFKKREFEVEYTGTVSVKNKLKEKKAIRKRRALSTTSQKNALQLYLNKIFSGDLVCEKKFSWMKTPKSYEEDTTYKKITDALMSYRGYKNISRKHYSLLCDFVCENEKVIIEYDERQHFSEARRLSLINYPDNIELNFDKEKWIKICKDVSAVDNQPYNRDEKRAFYDSVRDIEASRKGYKLIRIKHGDFDWNKESGKKWLRSMLKLKKFQKEYNPKKNILKEYDWRSLEVELQRIRVQYLKWLYQFNPQNCDALKALKEGSKIYVIDSPYGRSFSLSPAGSESVYIGGGRGVVKLAEDSYSNNERLLRETEGIKRSLNEKVRALRLKIKDLLNNNNYSAVWEYIQNFWWLRLGMHEFVYDVQFNSYPLPDKGVRYYVLVAIYNRIDLSTQLPECFSDKQILDSLRYKFSWNRFGMCSYDCGPIVIGKKEFVPYKEAARSIRSYFKDNAEELANIEDTDDKRDFAISSLENLYDFLLPYHKDPLGFIYYQDFLSKKDKIKKEIIKIDGILKFIANREDLDLG